MDDRGKGSLGAVVNEFSMLALARNVNNGNNCKI
jgi:hypothetical protein